MREALEAVSRHPMMGIYLSHLRNRKENPATGLLPDENFAREVMQLFSIGLHELNADGSVQRIQVLRQPGQALDTVQLAIAAVRRAAPFAPVAQLPRPWVFTETFLFNAQRRFKPRSLDT